MYMETLGKLLKNIKKKDNWYPKREEKRNHTNPQFKLEKIYHANTNQKKAGVSKLISGIDRKSVV